MNGDSTLAGVAQWTEHQPANSEVAGLIPSPGHIPGLQARSPAGDIREAIGRYFSCTSMFLSLPLSLSSPLSKNKFIKIFKKRISEILIL